MMTIVALCVGPSLSILDPEPLEGRVSVSHLCSQGKARHIAGALESLRNDGVSPQRTAGTITVIFIPEKLFRVESPLLYF